MGSITDVSSRLGDYMLQGWVLTDQSCRTPGCSVPMMRSPNGRTPIIFFCVNCDESPGVPRPKPAASISNSSSSFTSESHISRPSTPHTELSSTLSSPVFASPADTEESRRRREQSDMASSEISKRLLKGWAMLGDECPNVRCYGVPLVRPPKAGSSKDSRKECVICGNTYITEVDRVGREHLVQTDLQPDESVTATTSASPTKGKIQVEIPNVVLPRQDAVSLDALIPHEPENPLQALNETSQTLQSTLRSLSMRLSTLSSPHAVIDPSLIGLTADGISKVTQALSHVRQLQWSEHQAQKT